jgi:hypothetical protein
MKTAWICERSMDQGSWPGDVSICTIIRIYFLAGQAKDDGHKDENRVLFRHLDWQTTIILKCKPLNIERHYWLPSWLENYSGASH